MDWKILFSNENDNIPNEAYPIFLNAEFVCSVDKYLSVVKKQFLDEEVAENIKYKFGDLGDILPK